MLYYFMFFCILQAEIQKLVQSDSSLPNIEVVEKCFWPQYKSQVIGFGREITAKEFKRWELFKNCIIRYIECMWKRKWITKMTLGWVREQMWTHGRGGAKIWISC